jgi:hypothetical protein
MAKKKTNNMMPTITKVLAGGVGGYAGLMITTAAEKEIVKKNPESIGIAPAITSAIGIAGSMFTEKDTLLNDALNGVAIVSLAELIGTQIERMGNNTPPPPPEQTDNGITQGTRNIARMNANPILRMNGGNDVMRNQYMF